MSEPTAAGRPDLRRRTPRPGRLGHRAPAAGRGRRQPAAAHPRRARPDRAGAPSRPSSSRDGPSTCSWPPPRSAASSPTTPTRPSSSATTWRSRPTSSTRLEARREEAAVSSARRCIYPKLAPQPMKEEYLLTGPLEPTNEWYAIAKIAGIKMCQAYRRQYGFDAISLMPTNLYGPGDNFDLTDLARAAGADPQVPRGRRAGRRGRDHLGHRHAAARVPARGRPGRGAVFLMQNYSDEQFINVGTRRGPHHPRTGADGRRAPPASRGASSPIRASPTARRARCWTSAASRRWAGARASACARASSAPCASTARNWRRPREGTGHRRRRFHRQPHLPRAGRPRARGGDRRQFLQ